MTCSDCRANKTQDRDWCSDPVSWVFGSNVSVLGAETSLPPRLSLGPNASRLVLKWGCDLSESPHLNRMREEDSQANLQNERMVNATAEFGAPWLLNVSLSGDLDDTKHTLMTDRSP